MLRGVRILLIDSETFRTKGMVTLALGGEWGPCSGPQAGRFGHDTLRQPDVDTYSEPVTQSRGVVPGSCLVRMCSVCQLWRAES